VKPVDEFDLELLEAGAELDPARRRAVLSDPSLAPARAELAAARGWWLRHQPGLPQRSPALGARGAMGAAVVVAAIVLLLLVFSGDGRGVRPMGVPAADVWRVRDGQLLDPSEEILRGDQLSVALLPEKTSWLTVATLQQDGQVSLLVLEQKVQRGQRFELPGRIELDAYAGREWLVVYTHSEPLGRAELEQRLRALLPEPGTHAGEDRFVVEVTRGDPPR
jgi:hypothetical protein